MSAVILRLSVFLTVCALGTFALFMIFGQLRFQDEQVYTAEFENISGLKSGDFVRIAGVEVGKVKQIGINDQNHAVVEFSADDTVVLTGGTKVLVRYDNLLGDRFLELAEGTGGTRRVEPGQTIPLDRTAPALDLDALIGGFKPLFRALDPDQVNALSSQLILAFQGQGAAINAFLAQTASLTSTLADRDDLIGQVIVNLNTVLSSLTAQNEQFDKGIDELSQLVNALAARKTDISNSVGATNAATATITDMLSQARSPFKEVVAQSDRANGIVMADKDYFDNLLNTLPDTYQALGRMGIYGDFFQFYLCDAVLKLNGKGGQPVYVKVAGQDTGRCAPR